MSKFAKIAFVVALLALVIATTAEDAANENTNATNFTLNLSGNPALSNFTTIICGDNITCSQDSTNNTISLSANGTGGSTDHSQLTNLNWADAGHTIDAPVEMEQNPINNASLVRIGGYTTYAVSGEKLIINNEGGGAFFRLETNNINSNAFFGARYRGTQDSTITPLQNGDVMFRLGGIGTKANNTFSGATGEIRVQANNDWTSTNTPAVINFLVVKNGTTTQGVAWQINDSGYLIPGTNKTQDIGTASNRVKNIWTQTQTIGDLNEEYTYNHSFSYNIGDVVELDLGKDEVALAGPNSTRVVGVVTKLPYQDTYYAENGTAITITYDVLTVAIMGKIEKVKVKGIINKGDTLISAGNGYATSMYNRAFLTDYNLLATKSDIPERYNTYIIPGQKLGLALQSSDQEGYIPAIIGKG